MKDSVMLLHLGASPWLGQVFGRPARACSWVGKVPCGTDALAEHAIARSHCPVVRAPLLLGDHLPIALQLDAWGIWEWPLRKVILPNTRPSSFLDMVIAACDARNSRNKIWQVPGSDEITKHQHQSQNLPASGLLKM